MAVEALPTTKRVEIIAKREFVAAALNADKETFVLYIAALAEPTTKPIYPSCQAKIALLISEKIEVLTEYSNFSNIFSSNFAAELPEHNRINNYPINLLNNKQLLYGLI